jgi:NAD(P)-dependent dehydrogenase (short-subunit alcohol dehydrogenase family)
VDRPFIEPVADRTGLIVAFRGNQLRLRYFPEVRERKANGRGGISSAWSCTGVARGTAINWSEFCLSSIRGQRAPYHFHSREFFKGKALAAELRSTGAEAEFIAADVRRDDDVRYLIDRTVARFGRIDAAVNAAGTEGQPGPVTDQTAESFAATFDTNVLGTLLSMKHAARRSDPRSAEKA